MDTDATTGPAAVGLRDIIQQAISAYELAVATELRTTQEARRRHGQRLADLDVQDKAEARQREQDQHDQQAVAAAEAHRVQALAALADDLTESATSLLEHAALAYVRGFGPGATSIEPHIATDEQVAAAFAAAQVASVDLRAAVLKLAGEYLNARDWPRALEILAALLPGPSGALLDETSALFRTASLGEATAALASGDAERARDLAATWLQSHADDTAFTALLSDAAIAIRAAALHRIRELLESSDSRRARDEAWAWLREHNGDTDYQELLVRATATLTEQALVSGDQLRAEADLAVARQQVGDHPRLQAMLRRHPAMAWRTGAARLLGEFGGHSQPVRDLAFTADGDHLVAIDSTEVKTWNIAAPAQGRLEGTLSAAGACGLTPDGLLALSRNGALRSTENGERVRTVGVNAAHAFSEDGSLVALAARTVQWKIRMTMTHEGYPMTGWQTSAPVDSDSISRQIRWHSDSSPKVEGSVSLNNVNMRGSSPVDANFIGEMMVADIRSGQRIFTATLDRSYIFVDIAVSASARKVATVDPEGGVTVTDYDSGMRTHAFSVGPAQWLLNSIAFSPAGDLLLVTEVGRNATKITTWDISTGSVSWSWTTQRFDGAVAFSPDGQLVAALAMDGTVSMFDIRAQRVLPEIGAHGGVSSPCLAFSRDGSRLATGGNQTIKVWGL